MTEAAAGLFSRYGTTSVSMARVADEAGLTTAELREVFPAKRDLVAAVRQRGHVDWLAALADSYADVPVPLDRVLAIFTFLGTQDDEPSAPACLCTASGGAVAAEHVTQLHALVGGLVSEAELPSFLTDPLCLMIEGVITEGSVRGFMLPARAGRTAAAMLLAGYETDDFFS